jgi:hypothetical protein
MISAVLNLGSLFLGVASKLYPDSKDITSAANAADNVRQAYNVVSTTSVHESAARSIVAPMVVIEATSLHQEYMNDLMQIVNLRDIVATLTHLSMESSVAMGVKVENLIGSINPKRAGLLCLAGIEAHDNNIKTKEEKAKEEKEFIPTVNVGGKNMPDLNEYTPLAVGRTVVATLPTASGKDIDFPLTFRQIPVPIDPASLTRVFSAAKIEDGMFARFLMVQTKEITVPDLLTGKDIIKERFKIKNEDMSGYYREAMSNESGNRVAAVRTGVVSVNNLANTFIFTQDTANQLELSIGRRFANENSRNEIFKAVKANTIVVCNEDRGIFTFYTHGQSRPEIYTRKDLALKGKKDMGSNNLSDLVKLLNGGM